MRKTIVLILVLASFVACDLTKLEPAQTNSFMKHFGANGNTEASDLLKVADGYLILGNNTGGDFANVTSVLLKTDLNGNLLWKNQYENFLGRSLTTDGTSYFIVGDGIEGSNPTTMILLKTDPQGAVTASDTTGLAGFSFEGYGTLLSQAGEVIVTGRMSPVSDNTDSTFIYGYDPADLTGEWSEPRFRGVPDNSMVPSISIIEVEPDLFAYSQLSTNSSAQNLLEIIYKYRDRGGSDPDLWKPFLDYSIATPISNFTQNIAGDVALVQTVIENGKSKIAFANGIHETTLNPGDSDNDYYAGTLALNSNGYVVLGSTNNVETESGQTRVDTDFFVQQVSVAGQLESTGFTTIFGGTGSEEGKDIVIADDGGIVILGTMTNTNNAKTMVLVKLTNNGELIN